MIEILAAASITIIGVYAVGQLIAKVPEVKTAGMQEQQYVEQIGTGNAAKTEKKEVFYFDPNTQQIASEQQEVKTGLYSVCGSDLNCEANSGIGATARCIGNHCLPFTRYDDSSILWNPLDMGIKEVCGRRYLMGQGSPCSEDKQCSSSGKTCDIADTASCRMSSASSETYCNNKGRCDTKTYGKNPFPIRWKKQDLSDEDVRNLGAPDYRKENNTDIEVLAKTWGCNQLLTNKAQL